MSNAAITQLTKLVTHTVWKVSKYGVFSGPYFLVFELNTGKYGPEKLRIWTLFTQCQLWQTWGVITFFKPKNTNFLRHTTITQSYHKMMIGVYNLTTRKSFILNKREARIAANNAVSVSFQTFWVSCLFLILWL